ncbi:MAG: helix-turn-helix transcriptional regulator [Bacteroidota bacterium]
MGNTSHKSIPNALRKYRRIRGLTQRKVAKVLRLKSASCISLWEKGDSLPSMANAIRLSILYRTMVDGLFGDLVKALREEIHESENQVFGKDSSKS